MSVEGGIISAIKATDERGEGGCPNGAEWPSGEEDETLDAGSEVG
jgi:hypothetical protein